MRQLARLSFIILVTFAFSAAAAPELKYNGKILDPYCLAQIPGIDSGDDDQIKKPHKINLAECSYKSDDIIRGKLETFDGRVSLQYHEKSLGETFDPRESVSYQALGKIDGYDVVLVTSNGGGTGYFTSLYFIKIKQNWLTEDKIIPGGDRCNGGIADAKVQNGKLLYSANLTPADMIQLG